MQEYCDDIMSGKQVASKYVKLAVRRHLDDLKNAGERGFYFNEDYANRACNFFPLVLRHSTGEWAGQPFELTPFQLFVVWSVWGWRQVADDFRRFRKLYMTVARNAGKTALSAGLAGLLMNADIPREYRAEIYSAATKEDQAKLVYNEFSRMVDASPALKKRIKKYTGRHRMHRIDDLSSFVPLGSDSNSTDGLNPHGVIKDELHAWGEKHRGLHEKLSTGGGSRRQPLEIIITTAGDDRSDIWIETDEYACSVLEAADRGDHIDDRLFAFIARIDKEDDPFDPAVWPKANPNLGISCYPEYMEIQANEAQNRPEKKNEFLRYHANIRVGSKEKAIEHELWEKCRSNFDPDELRNKSCFGAWDLGRSSDFAAVALEFPILGGVNDEGEKVVRYRNMVWSFTNEAYFNEHRPMFQEWVDAGCLIVHPGEAVSFRGIKDFIIDEVCRKYNVLSWAYDPTFSGQMAQELLNDHGFEVFKFAQSAAKYNEPIRSYIDCVAKGYIEHLGDPCFSWQMGNLQILKNAKDHWMPDKGGDRDRKIDAAVATLMAHSEAIYAENFTSIYDTGGLFEVDGDGNQVDHSQAESGVETQQLQYLLDNEEVWY